MATRGFGSTFSVLRLEIPIDAQFAPASAAASPVGELQPALGYTRDDLILKMVLFHRDNNMDRRYRCGRVRLGRTETGVVKISEATMPYNDKILDQYPALRAFQPFCHGRSGGG